ncbi:uncharacterized protein METZ01_LOCUS492725 [marine metagenome]|uniref:Uncharacterized protein n=1 Tax=marine metagenome TaxID=408172 RepID=A0A383D661_9ZZZZ
MSSDSSYQWFDDFAGVAYRYYDLRMNLVPLFHDFKKARIFWIDTIKWWNDHSIKIRFVETGDTYWFIMGAESRRTEDNRFLFKVLPKSSHYDRFKKGQEGTAYLRLGTYSKKFKKDVKDDAKCNCGHIKEDHEEGKGNDACLFEDCDCRKFETFQINMLKKKKTVTDIKFLTEAEIKDDVLAWNCFSVNKYAEKK